jgi:L-serine deaminase
MSDGMPEDSVTLVLKKPLVIGEKTITELVIKEPNAGQMAMAEQTAKGGGTEQGIVLLGLACGLHPTVVKQISGSDYVKAQKVLGSFFEDGQETGATS